MNRNLKRKTRTKANVAETPAKVERNTTNSTYEAAIAEAHERTNTASGDFDPRDYLGEDGQELDIYGGFAFKGKGKGKSKGKKKMRRSGKTFSRRAPCKFWPLGTCTKGKDCPYFHYSMQNSGKGKGRGARAAAAEVVQASAAVQEPVEKPQSTKDKKS